MRPSLSQGGGRVGCALETEEGSIVSPLVSEDCQRASRTDRATSNRLSSGGPPAE
jgi:hypothetical protein